MLRIFVRRVVAPLTRKSAVRPDINFAPSAFKTDFKTNFSSSSGADHTGVTVGDWTSKEKVEEAIWVKEHEKEEASMLKLRLLKEELQLLEGQLEDILVDEWTDDKAKAKLVQWKMKMFECLSATRPGSSPLEQVIDIQEKQAQLLSELENVCHIEGVDLSNKAKRMLVDWALKGKSSRN